MVDSCRFDVTSNTHPFQLVFPRRSPVPVGLFLFAQVFGLLVLVSECPVTNSYSSISQGGLLRLGLLCVFLDRLQRQSVCTSSPTPTYLSGRLTPAGFRRELTLRISSPVPSVRRMTGARLVALFSQALRHGAGVPLEEVMPRPRSRARSIPPHELSPEASWLRALFTFRWEGRITT